MQVEFEADLDDLADAQLRLTKISKVVQRWKLQSSLLTGAGAAFVVYVCLDLCAYFDRNIINLGSKVAFGVASGGLASLLSFLVYDRSLRLKLRTYCAEQYGTETFAYWIEVSPQGIRTKMKNMETFLNWGHVKRIRLGAEEIDMHTNEGAIIPVLGRAFDSSTEMERFYSLAVRYCDEWSRSTAIQEIRRP